MCPPEYYGIQYEINPWMKIENRVDFTQARLQWHALYQTLLACGATIDLLDPVIEHPDMVFTANAGLYLQNKIILPHFKPKERQGELAYFQSWFEQAGFEFWNEAAPNSPYFEGAGDALPAGNKLFAGFGFRSERRFYEEAAYLKPFKLVYCELVDPYYYHIDTCFCPINAQLAIAYLPAFTKESQKAIAREIEVLEVTETEAKQFVCNAVVLDEHIVLPSACPAIEAELEKRHYLVHHCAMHEFQKAGGACKCLTLRID
jgi:N-dimethylarginine dimethylaminohydrolase